MEGDAGAVMSAAAGSRWPEPEAESRRQILASSGNNNRDGLWCDVGSGPMEMADGAAAADAGDGCRARTADAGPNSRAGPR